MIKKTFITFCIAQMAFGIKSQAQDVKQQFNPVYYGITSLAIAPDARGGAMGNVGAATDPDVNSQYWNPAKYPFTISRAGVSINYTPWLRQITSDIDLANVTGYYRIGNYDALSASLRYFSLGEVLDISNNVTIKPFEMALDVAYSRMLSETFSAAVALRYIHSSMGQTDDLTPGSAFAADLALYHNGYINLGNRECQLGWGLNISNIGSKISYDEGNTSEFLPTNLRLGLSLMIPIDEYNVFSISADANKYLVPTRPTITSRRQAPTNRTIQATQAGSWMRATTTYPLFPVSSSRSAMLRAEPRKNSRKSNGDSEWNIHTTTSSSCVQDTTTRTPIKET